MRFPVYCLLVLLLSACTFGVPISGKSTSQKSTTTGKSKKGNPNSYVVFGRRYFVMDSSKGFVQRGMASWYGPNFHGKPTSNGETYNMHAMTAAHKTLPLPTFVKVTNLANKQSIVVRVNDRGPFAHDRIIDLSYAAAKKLSLIGPGTGKVEVVALDSENNTHRPTVRAVPLKPEDKLEGEVFVQLGSFGSEANARNMVNDLRSRNEKSVIITEVSTENSVFYRVRLGPLLDVGEADSILKRLRRKGYKTARIVIDED